MDSLHTTELAYWKAEAERLAGDNARLEAENAALRVRVGELEGQIGALTEKVTTLAKLVFGTSSEKSKPVGSSVGKDITGGIGARRPRGQQSGSAGHGRRDYSALETIEEIHDVAEKERICPGCGAPYAAFGEETSYQIDWQVHIVRHLHRRPTYRRTCKCKTRGMLVAPVPAKPIPKGMFTSQFLARLAVEKYVLGRPLERIVAALLNDGFDVAKGTLVGALKALSELLGPLDAAIRERNSQAAHLHIDETSWKVFEAVADKVGNRWWLWTFLGPDTVVFLIDPTRSTRVVAEHLGIDIDAGSLEPGRQLLISSDFYSVYQSLGALDGLDPLWCWAHIRRYFIRASDAHQELRDWESAWTQRIGALYVAHHARQALEEGTTERLRAEADFARILGAMDAVRKSEAGDPTLHPGAAKVLATLDREWEGLCRHEEFPELPLDNNPAERVLRNPAVIRKNCYGSGSAWAATLAARIWTITATAERAGANPLAYLSAYLQECGAAGGKAPNPTALERFFPWVASEADLAMWRVSPPGPIP